MKVNSDPEIDSYPALLSWNCAAISGVFNTRRPFGEFLKIFREKRICNPEIDIVHLFRADILLLSLMFFNAADNLGTFGSTVNTCPCVSLLRYFGQSLTFVQRKSIVCGAPLECVLLRRDEMNMFVWSSIHIAELSCGSGES